VIGYECLANVPGLLYDSRVTSAKSALLVQLTVKVDPPVVSRIDRLIPRLGRLRGVATSRADVMREALMRGLKSMEEKST
jgi:hypothetical protein